MEKLKYTKEERKQAIKNLFKYLLSAIRAAIVLIGFLYVVKITCPREVYYVVSSVAAIFVVYVYYLIYLLHMQDKPFPNWCFYLFIPKDLHEEVRELCKKEN